MIDVRPLTAQSELQEAVRLQKEIWGFDDIELIPIRLFALAAKIGGHVFGAFDGQRMIGFAIAIPGIKPAGKSYLHSHMVGVVDGYRDQGVGRLLKWKQREEALARGLDLMEWTFDPLQLRNAFFNIERLGAVVRRYVLNQYGITTSHLQSGLPTDRCVSEWWMDRPRVMMASRGETIPRGEVLGRIEVPYAIAELRNNNFAQAREIQRRVSEQFLESFDRGLAVVGFDRTDTHGTYLLGPWEE